MTLHPHAHKFGVLGMDGLIVFYIKCIPITHKFQPILRHALHKQSPCGIIIQARQHFLQLKLPVVPIAKFDIKVVRQNLLADGVENRIVGFFTFPY